MAFWSSQTLKIKLPTLITPCDPKNIKQASYELGIGSEIYITKDHKNSNSQHTKRTLKKKEPFVIPPGQFAFLLTLETVKVPKNAIAFISMKAGVKFKGLINVSGFHVDPGFEGKLLFSVYNAGPSPIHLEHGKRCFLIWYANLDLNPNDPTQLEDSEFRKEPGFISIPTEVLNQISTDPIYSLQALTSEFIKIDNKYDSVLWWIAGVKWFIGIVVAGFIALIPLIYSDWDDIADYYSAINKLVEEQHRQTSIEADLNTLKKNHSKLFTNESRDDLKPK
ncbi:MAG: deoxycytidine triphosphate deaminase [Methylococcales bacterium]|nr:MAG: deoxycytidine triphosphate deaminase [Methylococcales bacterium]